MNDQTAAARVEQAGSPRAPSAWPSIKPTHLRGAFSLVLAAIIWEVAGRYLLTNALFFVPLSAVLDRMAQMWEAGTLSSDVAISLEAFTIGFVLASIVAIAAAVVMASSVWVRDLLDPWISAMYATPFVALAPLFTLWFGIGLEAHVAVVFVVVFFPVLISAYVGLTTTDRVLLEVARSFNAKRLQVFSKVRFPAALPFIVTGLRLGLARGLVGVVVAEMFGAKAGIGFRIQVAAQSFDTAGVFAGIMLFAVAGVVGVELVKVLERRLAPWRFQASDDE